MAGALAVWLLAATLLGPGVGCTAKRPMEAFRDVPAPEAAESLYQHLREWDSGRRSLQGTARAHVNAGDRKVRLDVMLVCERPGQIRFDANDFFDHLVFLVAVRDGVLTSYSVPENLATTGTATPERIGDLLGVNLAPESLVALLLGSVFFMPPTNGVVLRLAAAAGSVRLQACDRSGEVCTTVWADEQGRPLESLLEVGHETTHGSIRVRVTYARYRPVGPAEYPFRIRVTDERSGNSFRLDFQELELNSSPSPDLFRFVPPPGAQRWTW